MSSCRDVRLAAFALAAATASCLIAGTAPQAWASGSASPAQASGPAEAPSLQVQAQELAGRIAADGRTLDELDASYFAAQAHYRHLQSEGTILRARCAAAAASVAAARKALKEQALLAYMAGGAPVVTYRPDRPGEDPSLATAYAEIVAGGEQQAEASYRAALDTETAQSAQLDATTHQAALALADIHSDVEAATATLAARNLELSQVKGQLAAAVAQVQQTDQQAQEAAVKAKLSSEGQVPSAGAGGGAVRSVEPAPTVATAPAAPAPPTTAPPAIAPPATAPPTTVPAASAAPASVGGPNVAARGSSAAVAYAEAQLGKPYRWGGAGPDSFDCSGLVMMAWAQAGVALPHLAQAQYDLTARIPLGDLLPGDLVFFGTPSNVYHVGIYIGNGDMVDSPETGQTVSIQSIYWSDLLGAGRVRD